MNTTELAVEIRPEKNSGPYRIWTYDLGNTGAMLYQLSQQANRELVIMLDPNKPSLLVSLTVVHIYDFHMFTAIIYHFKGLFRSNIMQNCLFFSKGNVLSWLFLTVLWYVNAKTIWGNEVQNINHHDDFCQPLTTYAASIPAHSWSFSGEAGCFGTKSAFYPCVAVFRFHFTLS